jgi:hypothetical protein
MTNPKSGRGIVKATILASLVLAGPAIPRCAAEDPAAGFDRIIPGWTNYSTAFNATHDTGPAGDYATVASFYSPANNVMPEEYSVVVVSSGTRPPDLHRFQFRVCLWDGLEAFIGEPRTSPLTWDFVTATGGNPAQPDTTTRGGRPAYVLRFVLTNQPVVLAAGRTWLIGFAARGETQFAGELFVPTAEHPGLSDVQAGDLVIGGWRYLVDAGGSTIYSGQLAATFKVSVPPERPRLEIAPGNSVFHLTWSIPTSNFVLESSTSVGPNATWTRVELDPTDQDGLRHVIVPALPGPQWFRLRGEDPATN